MGWLIPSEITALRIRGPAAGIATAGNWGSSLPTSSYLPALITSP